MKRLEGRRRIVAAGHWADAYGLAVLLANGGVRVQACKAGVSLRWLQGVLGRYGIAPRDRSVELSLEEPTVRRVVLILSAEGDAVSADGWWRGFRGAVGHSVTRPLPAWGDWSAFRQSLPASIVALQKEFDVSLPLVWIAAAVNRLTGTCQPVDEPSVEVAE